MSKYVINNNLMERCLLTEVSPYETPLLFSNWGSFNYYRNLKKQRIPESIKKIMEVNSFTVPYSFCYDKNSFKRRRLSLIHPGNSNMIIEFYKKYSLQIIRHCNKSNFSIRYPHNIAKCFYSGKGKREERNYVEELNENKVYPSSFFCYMHFSHLHKYWDSDLLILMEKKYKFQTHLDIQNFFPSIYTHTISWAVRGKSEAKRLIGNDKSFGCEFDCLMQKINHNEGVRNFV